MCPIKEADLCRLMGLYILFPSQRGKKGEKEHLANGIHLSWHTRQDGPHWFIDLPGIMIPVLSEAMPPVSNPQDFHEHNCAWPLFFSIPVFQKDSDWVVKNEKSMPKTTTIL